MHTYSEAPARYVSLILNIKVVHCQHNRQQFMKYSGFFGFLVIVL